MPADAPRGPGRLFVAVNGLLAAMILAVFVVQAWQGHETAMESGRREAGNLAASLEQHAAQTFAGLATALDELVPLLPVERLDDPALAPALHGLLEEREQGLEDVVALLVLDAEGRLLHSSHTSRPEDLRPASAAALAAPPPGSSGQLLLGSPSIARFGIHAGRPVLAAGERLLDRDGGRAGTLVALLDLTRLQNFYDALEVGPQGVVGLARADGMPLVRQPVGGAPILLPPAARGTFLGAGGSEDGGIRLVAYRRLPGQPLLVHVGLGLDDLLAGWRRQLRSEGTMAAVLLIVLLGGAALIKRAIDARQRAAQAHSARLARLAAASGELPAARAAEPLAARLAAVIEELFPGRAARVRLAGGVQAGAAAEADGAARLMLRAADGSQLGLIALEGAPRSADEQAVLTQLARIAAVQLENIRLLEARARAAAEAEAARAEIAGIFEAMSDAFCSLDHGWRFTHCNRRAEQLLGRPVDRLIGHPLWEAFPETVGLPVHAAFHRALEEGRPVELEFLHPSLERWLEIRAFPHKGGLAVYFRDITERLETEAQLRQAQKMEAMGQLTGGVAHDLNNLLTVILGNAELLAERLGHEPALQRCASLGLEAAQRAADLVDRLLAFARRKPLAPRPLDVAALLDGLAPLLEHTLGAGIRLERVEEPGLWPVLADRGQLENALVNLAVNGRDAMTPKAGGPATGTLTLCAANKRLEEGEAGEEIEPGCYVELAVADTGSGMDREVLARVFEPFFTTKPPGKGSGLGLPMVYGFARQSRGLVRIASHPGHGTKVSLLLPKAPAVPRRDK
ncbi:PAS domain-containing protein [Marinimicrococcus flavescens]|uniref:histidine kinase n=1 Tax=Marinimicrococcus flavescens TaxID=3031815 RepID=A0AAP3XQJ9_9PROT|nr:PAS domain-containing protein [Marinimicrococcus flavescens]